MQYQKNKFENAIIVSTGNLKLKKGSNFVDQTVNDVYAAFQKQADREPRANSHPDSTLPRILSMHTGRQVCVYAPVENISNMPKEEAVTNRFLKIRVKNNQEKIFEIICSDNTQFYTCARHHKAFVRAGSLGISSLLYDEEGRIGKVISSEEVSADTITGDFYTIDVKYNKNFFYNGLLIR
jgi:hypothetical protein